MSYMLVFDFDKIVPILGAWGFITSYMWLEWLVARRD